MILDLSPQRVSFGFVLIPLLSACAASDAPVGVGRTLTERTSAVDAGRTSATRPRASDPTCQMDAATSPSPVARRGTTFLVGWQPGWIERASHSSDPPTIQDIADGARDCKDMDKGDEKLITVRS